MNRHTFRTRIGRTGILRSVLVPAEIVNALGGAMRIPVIARYGGEITRSTLSPAGGSKRRLVLQMDVLRPAQLDAGDTIEVSLEPTKESHKQALPADLSRALQFRPAAAAELDRASPSTWRMIIERLEEARTPETRQRRIERMVERLVIACLTRCQGLRENIRRISCRICGAAGCPTQPFLAILKPRRSCRAFHSSTKTG